MHLGSLTGLDPRLWVEDLAHWGVVSTFRGVAALGKKGVNAVAEEPIRRKVLGRSRQANVPGGRQHSYRVKVTGEERARLSELAAEQQVSVPRLMVEAALTGGSETPTQRREAMAELFAIRRVLSNNAININQMAKAVNVDGEIRPEAVGFLQEARQLVGHIDVVLEGLVRP